ncbi:HAD family hydrolase [Novacetimonas pomaceti]|uniref:Hydrolase n=1 Tax=Novacetimonas pomaceti TaxID=2021998 RepID=A0A318Q964_9PROT|nr:HAD family hydrolase [Novacetimonas pomaceti]MBV1833880.1 HAD family hydrolase [Novacetimonas pomaceti]PYD46963.1 Cof-type HAD-IIB family hydrolase [Novacetimonas pomaceti]PYD76186.1 hydrolase [Novacetimonas pomaceti]
MTARRPPSARIRMVVSDIDGTLVTPDKRLTPAALAAAEELRRAGIALCLVSSRGPVGMRPFLAPLRIDRPIAALNGGLICTAGGEIMSRHSLDPATTREAVEELLSREVEPWLFIDYAWLVRRDDTPLVRHEEEVVKTTPVVAPDLSRHYEGVGKIMGVSTDEARLRTVERELSVQLAGRANVHRSSECLVDVTHPLANKGHAARELAHLMDIDIHEVACIGDMNNDIPMLDVAGVAIAMGNAPAEVQGHAHFVTDTNTQDGWARAMERFVLPRA